MVYISLANSCQREMRVHKGWCSCWQPLCIEQWSLRGSAVSMWLMIGTLCVPTLKASLPTSLIPNYTCEGAVYLYHNPHSHIKAFSSMPFVGQAWPVSKSRVGEKSQTLNSTKKLKQLNHSVLRITQAENNMLKARASKDLIYFSCLLRV